MGDRKAIAVRKKKNAARQRAIREARDIQGLCRTCGYPAVISERTGRLAKQCAKHLACDVERKDCYILAWQVDRALEYPLGPPL